MRDQTVYGMYQNLLKYVQQIEQSVRLGLTGEAVRAEALTQLLLSKGIFTQEELNSAIGEVIRKANEPKPEAEVETPKVELTTPTPDQVQEIQKSAETQQLQKEANEAMHEHLQDRVDGETK